MEKPLVVTTPIPRSSLPEGSNMSVPIMSVLNKTGICFPGGGTTLLTVRTQPLLLEASAGKG